MKTCIDPRPLAETPRMPPQLEPPPHTTSQHQSQIYEMRRRARPSAVTAREMSVFWRCFGRCSEDHTGETSALHQMTDETWCIFLRRHKNARWESCKTQSWKQIQQDWHHFWPINPWNWPASASTVHVYLFVPQTHSLLFFWFERLFYS